MVSKKNVFLAFFTTALLLALANLALVRAPPDPSEGWMTDYQWVGDWNWHVDANSTGHWRWIPGTPPTYVFVGWISKGTRGGGWGVWTEGPLQFWWRDDYRSEYIETSGNDETTQFYTGQTHLVNCTSQSGFANIWGQHWVANASAQITI